MCVCVCVCVCVWKLRANGRKGGRKEKGGSYIENEKMEIGERRGGKGEEGRKRGRGGNGENELN